MIFGHTLPNICPGCHNKPYPAGVACQHCGFKGEPLQDHKGLRWIAGVMLVLFVAAAVITLVAII